MNPQECGDAARTNVLCRRRVIAPFLMLLPRQNRTDQSGVLRKNGAEGASSRILCWLFLVVRCGLPPDLCTGFEVGIGVGDEARFFFERGGAVSVVCICVRPCDPEGAWRRDIGGVYSCGRRAAGGDCSRKVAGESISNIQDGYWRDESAAFAGDDGRRDAGGASDFRGRLGQSGLRLMRGARLRFRCRTGACSGSRSLKCR